MSKEHRQTLTKGAAISSKTRSTAIPKIIQNLTRLDKKAMVEPDGIEPTT
ncbi:hypothetical protein [Varunaivibrio sulfuroxidans]|nr:hypothetical protein [Varunaivibrio sulfuroxidans]WES29539.1 hypothetical protein P3M64_07680 [Varunaivibrio sulfuroxidans]WES31768.1 hypothetical protein P3M64_05230 [Varunaivibrio sulfuroxidans]